MIVKIGETGFLTHKQAAEAEVNTGVLQSLPSREAKEQGKACIQS